MIRQRHKNISGNVISKSPSVVELFARIHESYASREQNEPFNRLKYKCIFLLIFIPVLCFFGCHNRIYNAWAGPFHFNLDEFITHWKIYSGALEVERSILSSLFSFDEEYLQIELGANQIDEDPKSIFRVYFRHPSYEKLLYTFNPVKEQSIAALRRKLLVKLPTNLQSYFHKRLPYRFELFNSDTLQCIAQQLGILSEVYPSELKNSMYIQIIEEIYDRNATEFNMKVIAKCGILLGYLYDCQHETVYSWYSNQVYRFTSFTGAFNASSSYSPYMTYLFGGLLFLWCLTRAFVDLFRFLWHLLSRRKLFISPDVQNTLSRFKIDSIQILDYLLKNTTKENNYRDRLFLIQDQYLIIFKINLNERNLNVLRQFYMKTPFIILNITNITAISSYNISISNDRYLEQIPFPTIDDYNINNGVDWLHERLMHYSMEYQYSYKQEQLRRRQQEAIRAQEEQRYCRLAAFTREEEEIQQFNENDLEQIWNRVPSASPRFIAQFRFEGPRIVDVRLPETNCRVCLDTLQPGEYYSQWPCAARHIFHYYCMLKVLRTQNQCPLCRHSVEAANLPPIEVAYRIILSRIASRVIV